ncbi:MAG: GDP-mannose 4,6-dehydratase [Anaerolineae bacterium]|nr:GDP-mannose 4,6-dehydratase [Anaerolineae bacterium]MCB9103892.1 GDP-mannose 4,6-dehydratase [Anaerolineales bacterium]
MKRALITGITGQDGSYLTEFLLSQGYAVDGLTRNTQPANTTRLNHLLAGNGAQPPALRLHQGDLLSTRRLRALIEQVQPDEIYHLAAPSRPGPAAEPPDWRGDITVLGTLHLLEALRRSGTPAKFFHAASAEIFGPAPPPQSETTPLAPASRYAAAKGHATRLTRIYRQRYGLFAANGILFNHESIRRSNRYVSRKITQAVAAIATGEQYYLYLGNLNARRDWGYAPDYVAAMWLMLQQPQADDFVIGSGQAYTVKDFVAAAFDYAGLDWQAHVRFDPRFYRPGETYCPQADIGKIGSVLGWRPRTCFQALIRLMVDAELKLKECAYQLTIDNRQL